MAKKMNLSDEGALLLMATEHAAIDRAMLVKWADEKIADWDTPTEWLIELSTLQSSRLEDFVSVLRHACGNELCDTEHRIMAVIDAHAAGILALDSSIGALWKIWSGSRNLYDTDRFPNEFADALVAWDCQEDLSVISPSLAQHFERLFQEFRKSHPSVTSYYRHQRKQNGQQDAVSNDG